MTSDSARNTGACPDDGTLAAFCGRDLAEPARLRVETHAKDCIGCKLVIDAFRSHASIVRSASSLPMDPSLDAFMVRVARHARLVLRSGSRVGRYSVERPVGAGSMGIVYAAHDPELDRKVALKVLRPELVAIDELHARVQQEARAMARLSHPNVVTVHDVGTSDGRMFVAMELVDGETLADWLRHGERHWRTVAAVFSAIGRGLAAAHAVNLVHRDLKPQNVLVGRDGRPRITDFGLARVSDSDDGVRTPTETKASNAPASSRRSGLVGTPAYMAPEQLRGEMAGAHSDQYAFCVCYYEALYGERPQTARPHEVGNLGALERVRPPTSTSGVPESLFRVLSRGLHPDRAERFPSMEALLEAAEAALHSETPKPRRHGLRVSHVLGVIFVLAIALSGTRYALRRGSTGETATGSMTATRQPEAPVEADATNVRASDGTTAGTTTVTPPLVPTDRPTSTQTRRGPPVSVVVAGTRDADAATTAEGPPANRGAVSAPSSSAATDLLGRRF